MTRFPPRPALLIAAAAAALMVGAGASAIGAENYGQTRGEPDEMRAREEIRQTYRISPRGTVRVRGIAGPVVVETTNGGDTADVHIVRMAATERELQCYRTEISSSPDRLSIEHVQRERERECRSIRSRQEVRLRVPRSVNLDFSTIAGALDVAPVDGLVRADSIAGHATFARVRAAEIDSIAGGLTLGVAPDGAQGVRISSVVGPVDLHMETGADADLSVDSVMGSVRSLVEGVDFQEDEGTYRARLGSGRGRVTLSSVVGPVRLRRP
jgi:hypothetical protein